MRLVEVVVVAALVKKRLLLLLLWRGPIERVRSGVGCVFDEARGHNVAVGSEESTVGLVLMVTVEMAIEMAVELL